MIRNKQQRADLAQAKGLAKWFSVSVTIKVFGKVIWSFTWPPEVVNSDDNV